MDHAVAAFRTVSRVVTSRNVGLGERHDITLLRLAAVPEQPRLQPQQPQEKCQLNWRSMRKVAHVLRLPIS